MTDTPTLVPLHAYQSPNGNGLCSYRFGMHICGRKQNDMFHVRPSEPVEQPTSLLETPADPVRRYLDQFAGAAYQTYHGAAFPVDDPPTTSQVVSMFQDQALRLAVAKDQTYRQAWRRQGYIGNMARILSKAARLRAMVWGDGAPALEEGTPEIESVRDTLLDMSNLCAFMAANLTADNRWGDKDGK